MLNKFIDDHSRNLQEGNSERLSCPSCGGINTFTITKMQGFVLWNCYKASCSVRGGKDSERTKSDIAHKLRSNYHVTCTETFLEPDSFTNFREHPKIFLFDHLNIHPTYQPKLISNHLYW